MNTASTKSRFAPKASTTQARGSKATKQRVAQETVHAAHTSVVIDEPSGTRLFTAFFAQVVTGYGLGSLLLPVVAIMEVAAVALSGFAFMGFAVWFIGVVTAMFVAVHASTRVFMFVAGYKPGEFARISSAVSTKVRGLFKRGHAIAA
jgi:hypothetical protein